MKVLLSWLREMAPFDQSVEERRFAGQDAMQHQESQRAGPLLQVARVRRCGV